MKVKRLFSLVTAVTLVFTFVFTSVASADTISEEKRKLMIAAGELPPDGALTEDSVKIKKDRAIEIAKTILEDPSAYEMGNVFLNPKWGTKGGNWTIDFYRLQNPGGNANINVDADTGEIIGFNIWDNVDGRQNFIAKLTRSEAQAIAEKYLKEKLKEEPDNYELRKEEPYYQIYRMGGVKEPVIYNFSYVKKYNGIMVTDYNIYIGIDGTSGKVRNFNINRINIDAGKLPSTEGIMTAEQALQKYKDSLNVTLQYVAYYEEKPYGPSKQKIILAYIPTNYVNMLDAGTGQSVNWDGSTVDLTKQEIIDLADNPIPLDPDAKLESKEITEKEARALAEKYKATVEELLGVKFQDNNQSYYGPRYGGQEDILYFNWYTNNEKSNAHFDISINARTGHINNMNMGKYDSVYEMGKVKNNEPEAVVEKVNWKQGKEKVMELVKKLVPAQYGFFADQSVVEPVYSTEGMKYVREHNYGFTRVVNGLRFRDNGMNIAISRETGELKNFYFNWSDLDFPSTQAIISKEQAMQKYFEGTEAVLSYFFTRTYDNKTGMEIFGEVPKLIYTFKNNGLMYGDLKINAVTGKLVDWNNREVKPVNAQVEPKLENHWAKRSLELLTAQGLISGEDIDYDSELTRLDVVKMASLAKGMMYYDAYRASASSFTDVSKDDENYIYIENAVRQKILLQTGGKFNGGAKITKEEFVQLLVNLLGYSDIVKHNGIFKVDGVKNISADATGSVAICYALDILPVKPGETFDGSAKVTLAEASAALYKALEFIK